MFSPLLVYSQFKYFAVISLSPCQSVHHIVLEYANLDDYTVHQQI